MSFTTFVFVTMLAIMHKGQRHVNVEKEHGRLYKLAKSMSMAIENHPEFKLFNGPAHKYASATILVTTAWGESGFREDVQTCKRKGDAGRSITSFQMMKPWAFSRVKKIEKEIFIGGKKYTRSYSRWVPVFTEKQLCESTDLAAEQALYMFRHLRTVCPKGAPINLFAAYGTGKCYKRVKATDNRCYMWNKVSKKIGLKNTQCGTLRKKVTLDQDQLNKIVLENKKWLDLAGIKI